MADYVSTLTGPQMDAALLDMAEHNSEAYAVGERNGIAVAPDDVTYHNNARYYAQIASSQIVGDASSAVRWDTDQSEVLTDAQKAQARENINAASDSDVVKITSQTLTTAQQSQARANIMAGGSNRNLLDNPWFTVNQRGQSSYTGTTWGVDRWTFSGADSNHTITINADKTVTIQGLFYEKKEYGFSVGDVVTISYMLANGTVVSKTGTIPNSEGFAVGNSQFGFYWRTNGIGDFQIWATSALTIKAVKLELGAVSTLANDAPPDYGAEFLKCARYFLRIKRTNSSYPLIGTGITLSTSNSAILIPTPVPMRNTTITVSYSGNFAVLSVGSSGNLVTAMSYYDHTAAGVRINCTLSDSVFTPFYGCALQGQGNTSGYIDLSADL